MEAELQAAQPSSFSLKVSELCCQGLARSPSSGFVDEVTQHISGTAYYLLWCAQHNKYLREEYALDALAEHAVVPDDPTREVPNPAWAAADAKLVQAEAHVSGLQAEYGLEALMSVERQHRTMRGFKIAKGELNAKIWKALRDVMRLEARRNKIPKRVPVQAVTDEPVVKLAPERKHLTNPVKMVAYHVSAVLKVV